MRLSGIWFPDPAKYSPRRLFCLDVLRGIDMLYLAVLAPFINWRLFRFHLPDCTASESLRLLFMHNQSAFAPTATGISLHDFGQPLFLFICGAAVPLALPKRLGPNGGPTVAYWRHVAYRVGLLAFFACLNRDLLKFDLGYFIPQADTLLVIAVGYRAAALSILVKPAAVRWALPVAFMAAHWAVQQFCGDYTWDGNVNYAVDKAVFGGIGNSIKGIDGVRHYAFALTSLGFAAVAMFGARATEILLSEKTRRSKAVLLAVVGAGMLAAGWIATAWIPAVRYIYTLSFTLMTTGLSALCLAGLYVATDIFMFRRFAGPLLLFGSCSLFVWEVSVFGVKTVETLATRIAGDLPNLFGNGVHSLVYVGIAEMCIITVAAAIWYRLKSSFKQKKGDSQ